MTARERQKRGDFAEIYENDVMVQNAIDTINTSKSYTKRSRADKRHRLLVLLLLLLLNGIALGSLLSKTAAERGV